MSTLFFNCKAAVVNGLRKLRNSHSSLIDFVAASFDKIPLFSKDLFTFIISCISLFFRVIPEIVIDEIPFLIYLPSKLNATSTKT